MTSYKISGLTALTTPSAADLLAIVDTDDTTTPPAGPAGSDKKITVGTLIPGIVYPSGDVTGAQDVTNVQASVTASGIAVLAPGTWYGSSTVTIGLSQAVRGMGKTQVTWNNLSSGPAFTIANAGAYSALADAALTGLRIDGTSAGSGAAGFQAGDIVQLDIDVWVSNFTGGSTGAHFLNGNHWTEQARVALFITNCDTGVKLDQSGSGTNSYDRCDFNLYFNQNANQNGIVFAGATSGAQLLEGSLRIRGNWTNSATSVTSSVLSFTSSNANITASRLDIGCEVNGSAGTFSAQTIVFKDATTKITKCAGVIDFLVDSNHFSASNNNGNFWFSGPVTGDNTLLLKQAAAPNDFKVTSGFPTGWTGSVEFTQGSGDGLVFVIFTLNVAASTSMTANETLVAAATLPTWATPVNNRFIVVDISGTHAAYRVGTDGSVHFVGPAQTAPAGGAFPYGQGIYSNSL